MNCASYMLWLLSATYRLQIFLNPGRFANEHFCIDWTRAIKRSRCSDVFQKKVFVKRRSESKVMTMQSWQCHSFGGILVVRVGTQSCASWNVAIFALILATFQVEHDLLPVWVRVSHSPKSKIMKNEGKNKNFFKKCFRIVSQTLNVRVYRCVPACTGV